jgi:hypothetical protein
VKRLESHARCRRPIDYVLIEFTGNKLTGRAAEELVSLVDRGIVHVYDVMVVGKDANGAVYPVDLAASSGQAGGFADLDGARSGVSRIGWVHRFGSLSAEPAWSANRTATFRCSTVGRAILAEAVSRKWPTATPARVT